MTDKSVNDHSRWITGDCTLSCLLIFPFLVISLFLCWNDFPSFLRYLSKFALKIKKVLYCWLLYQTAACMFYFVLISAIREFVYMNVFSSWICCTYFSLWTPGTIAVTLVVTNADPNKTTIFYAFCCNSNDFFLPVMIFIHDLSLWKCHIYTSYKTSYCKFFCC